MMRLSSGTRVRTAMDDAAGLAVAVGLRSRFVSQRRAAMNATQALSQMQVAEGALDRISDVTLRLRELTVQAATDSLSDTDRGYLDIEYQELISEIDRITDSTRFNGQSLLDGSTLDYQIGADPATTTTTEEGGGGSDART